MRVFALYNIKGGVGKTASAVNLAYLSALGGFRTLVWDLDPQGAASYCFRIRPKIKGGSEKLIHGRRSLDLKIRGTDYSGLDLLPADFRYRHMDLDLGQTKRPVEQLARLLLPLSLQYDHLFLDCPPSISLVSESVFVAADVLLVPTVPTPLSLRTLEQLRRHLCKRVRPQPRLLPFFCLVDRRKALHREVTTEASGLETKLLSTEIPYSSTVEKMSLRRAPVGAFAPSSTAARAYDRLWQEVLETSGL